MARSTRAVLATRFAGIAMQEEKRPFSFSRGSVCPICKEYLIVITAAHAEKHGLTKAQLSELIKGAGQ